MPVGSLFLYPILVSVISFRLEIGIALGNVTDPSVMKPVPLPVRNVIPFCINVAKSILQGYFKFSQSITPVAHATQQDI